MNETLRATHPTTPPCLFGLPSRLPAGQAGQTGLEGESRKPSRKAKADAVGVLAANRQASREATTCPDKRDGCTGNTVRVPNPTTPPLRGSRGSRAVRRRLRRWGVLVANHQTVAGHNGLPGQAGRLHQE